VPGTTLQLDNVGIAHMLPAACPALYEWVCRYVYACFISQQPVEGVFNKAKACTHCNTGISMKESRLVLFNITPSLMRSAASARWLNLTPAEVAASLQRDKAAVQQKKHPDQYGHLAWHIQQADPVTSLAETAAAVDVELMLQQTGGPHTVCRPDVSCRAAGFLCQGAQQAAYWHRTSCTGEHG